MGDLNTARYAHQVLVRKGEFYIVGGFGKYGTERCELLKDNSMQCTTAAPYLDHYANFPGLIPVLDNYCPI